MTTYCKKRCCKIQQQEYTGNKTIYDKGNGNRKAGLFVHDPETGKLLLVQSRGFLWGFPKGSMEGEETVKECAIREMKEETGIEVDIETLGKNYFTHRNTYFLYEMKECEVDITRINNNDSCGITWINDECLKNCIQEGRIKLNKAAETLISKFL